MQWTLADSRRTSPLLPFLASDLACRNENCTSRTAACVGRPTHARDLRHILWDDDRAEVRRTCKMPAAAPWSITPVRVGRDLDLGVVNRAVVRR
jgi:hypothetical protein